MIHRNRRSRISYVPLNQLQDIVNSSLSAMEVLTKLGFKTYSSQQYGVLYRVCTERGIDLSVLKSRGEVITLKTQDKNAQIVADWLADTPGFIAVQKGWQMNLRTPLRDWLFERAQCQCEKCGWKEPHPDTGLPPLQIHHDDGDAANNRPDNLKVLCPNCHSLTPNFGRRNKSKRVNRYANNP